MKEPKHEYFFIFELIKGDTIGIKMDPGVTFVFSGKYLMHIQIRLGNICNESDFF